jgi:choline dehydrogenase-like flavoprotein
VVLESGGRNAATGSDLTEGESIGDLWQPLSETRVRGLGGTSREWTPFIRSAMPGGLRTYPLTDLDLASRAWVPNSGWPVEHNALDRFYTRAKARLGVKTAPNLGSTSSLEAPGVKVAFAHFVDRLAIEAMEAEVQISPHIDVYLNATTLRLQEDSSGVRHATNRAGDREFTVGARVFVLAAGGIENARLMLLSDGHTPGGIGNHHDNVGRYFMEHLTVMHGVIVPEGDRSLHGFHSNGHDVMQSGWRLQDEVIEKDGLLGVILWPVAADAESVRNAYFNPWSRLVHGPRRLLRARLKRPDRLLRFGLRSASGLLRRSPHAIIHAHIEQPPRRENRVTLSEQADSLGQRRARLEWRIGAQECDSLLRTLKRFDAALRFQGAGHLARLPDAASFDMLVEQSHHHMGTTRMHIDPARGVIDADCRVHGVTNLYVAGSSVMPTGGAATVTLTAVALALRLADHLKARLEERA